MSFFPAKDPAPGDTFACDAIELMVVARSHDLGGFSVRRALPTARRRLVGPFIFLDHMGPAILAAGTGVDVRPHPHIGLSTLTWLFDGAITHRDSVGAVSTIRPGEVNWMTAGRGVVHSERTPPEARAGGPRLHGLQCWVALPADREEIDPGFLHLETSSVPRLAAEGVSARVVAGAAWGLAGPVPTESPAVLADIELGAGARVPIDPTYAERALYVAEGTIDIAGDRFGVGALLVLRPGDPITVRSVDGPARVALVGGEPLEGPRFIWWNFVSSRKDRIEAAKADWKAARFDAVPGETEFIPLPEA